MSRGTDSPSRGAIIGWLLSVTRPVLAPLAASTLCRVADLLAGVGLFALGAAAIVHVAQDLPGGRASLPWGALAAMAGLSLLKAALRYAEQFLGHLVAFRCLELLRAEVFGALIPRAPRVVATSRSGDLLARLTKDIDRIEVFFAHTVAPVTSAVLVPVTVCAGLGVMVSWPVALAALAATLGACLGAPLVGWRASLSSSRASAALRADVAQHVTDSVQGMSEVVGYGRVDARLEEMERLDAELGQASRPAVLAAGLRRLAGQVLTLGAPVLVVAVGAAGVRDGSVSAAALAGAAAAALRLAETARGVEDLSGSLTAAQAAAERVFEVVHAPVEVPDGDTDLPHSRSHQIVWDAVSYTYPGAVRSAVQEVSLTARAARWTCLVGASGSGKSTLAQLVVRFDDPTAGRILVDGLDVSTLTAASLRREVAMVTQNAHLFRASVADNVRLGAPEASDEEVREACKVAGIHRDIEAMAQGYDTVLDEGGSSVSGGQRQRLALARALLGRPAVLLADEVTSHLDPALAAQVRQSVRQFLPHSTIVEVTHRLESTRNADHVVVIDDGRVVQAGSPADLWNEEGPLRTLAARTGA